MSLEKLHHLIKDEDKFDLKSTRLLSDKEQNKIKSTKLPFVTISGIFKERKIGKLEEYSGLICIDIDKLESEEEANSLKDKLFQIKIKPVLAFISPRGKGVKAVYGKIQNIEEHKIVFNLLQNYLNYELGIEIDISGKDVSRACFLSYDPKAILDLENEKINLFDTLKEQIKVENHVDSSLAQIEDEEENISLMTLEEAIENSLKSIRNAKDGEKHLKLLNASRFLGGYINEEFTFTKAETLLNNEIEKKANVLDRVAAFRTIQEGLSNGMRNPITSLDVENEDDLSNSIISKLLDKLPKSLQELLQNYKLEHEKDIAFLSVITVASSLLPEFHFQYGKKDKYYLNLFTYIIGKSGSGKSTANIALKINSDLEDDIINCLEWEYPLLAGDASKASLIELLHENDGNGYIHESETDSLSSANKQEWGNFSDLLRKAFEHEKYSTSRKNNDKAKIISINNPKLSILLTSTPNQLPKLVTHSRDGLAARNIFYSIEKRPVWHNQFQEKPLSDISIAIVSDLRNLLIYQKNNKDLKLKIAEEDKEIINEYFKHKYSNQKNEEIDMEIIVRLAVISIRVSAIIHLISENGKETIDLTINSGVISLTLKIMEELLKHSEKVVKSLPQASPLDNLTIGEKYYYSKLPEEFKLQDLKKLNIDIRNSTFKKTISNIQFFEKINRGHYKKRRLQ